MRAVIPVENHDTLAAVRRFLKRLLEADVVDALLVPMETPTGTVTPALVSDPALVDAANPLAPVLGVNAAPLAGLVSVREPRGRVGAVLRACELRALVELVKLQQASLDDMVTIGVDCFGTYDVPDYVAKARESGDQGSGIRDQGSGIRLWRELSEDLITDPQTLIPDLRDACQMCEKPVPEGADIVIELFGADLEQAILVSLSNELGERLSPPLSPPRGGKEGGARWADPSSSPALSVIEGLRADVIERVVAAHTQVRDARFAEIRQRLDEEGVEGVFAACVCCHNCMTVCPLCYCKTCLFKSPVFDHEPAQFMRWAQRKGATRLPPDTMLFHLTRLNHMVTSCVGCGMCTSACPAELPVTTVFRAIGQHVQAVFDYEPGRSVEEPLPLITFREDEWMEVGEE